MDEGNLEVKFPHLPMSCYYTISTTVFTNDWITAVKLSVALTGVKGSHFVSEGTRFSPGGLHLELGVVLLLKLCLRHRKLGFCASVSLQREIQRDGDRHKCVPFVVFLLGEGHIKGQKHFGPL